MKPPLPLFPLQTVLFPDALLGLKVFEARYLDLVSQCLRDRMPFGVVCLKAGSEAGRSEQAVRMESVGVVAHIESVDSQQAGILDLRCRGGLRFRMTAEPVQRDDGLWLAPAVDELPADPPRAPGPAMLQTVTALAAAIRKLKRDRREPFGRPYRLDDAGWVANRWCEVIPIPLPAKQKLMELDDPVIRLSLVDGFLRDKKVIVD